MRIIARSSLVNPRKRLILPDDNVASSETKKLTGSKKMHSLYISISIELIIRLQYTPLNISATDNRPDLTPQDTYILNKKDKRIISVNVNNYLIREIRVQLIKCSGLRDDFFAAFILFPSGTNPQFRKFKFCISSV